MARPKSDLPSAAAIRALADPQGRLAVRVIPGARSDSLELGSGVVLVKVRTMPHGGKANEAVLILLAEALGTAKSRLQLLRGATGSEKMFLIDA